MFYKLISKFPTSLIKRCLLTQTYSCPTLWKDKFKGIDCKLSANDLAIQLQANLNDDVPISALDFDILMNKANEMDLRNIKYIINIIRDFRKTQEAIKAFESSAHGIIRNLIDIDESFEAYDIIRDREKTGVFLDEITVNLLIDKFIIGNYWEYAFFTAAEWILQEDMENSKLAISMCLISCLHFWQKSLWQQKPTVVDVSKLPVEYKFRRYLKTNYFDDHFDLCSDNYRRRLLGKCFFMLSNHIEILNKENHVKELKYYKNNIGMLGLVLHEKLEELIPYLEKWLENERETHLNSALIDIVDTLIGTAEKMNENFVVFYPTHTEQEITDAQMKFQNVVSKFRSENLIDDQDLFSNVLNLLTNEIESLCDTETNLVTEKYNKFMSDRVKAFEKAKLHLRNKEVLDRSKEKLLQLTEQEEMIKYFEKFPEIMYKSWLAKRTREEKKFSTNKSNEENLDNLKKKAKPKFIVQHTL